MAACSGVWLEDLTWVEAREHFAAGRVVVLPIGAIAKEHGFHLPLKTDYLVARALADGVRVALPVVIAPIVSVGYYPAFVAYAGSQHLRAETFEAVVADVLGKLVADGVTRLAVINTGVSTEAPLWIAVRDLYAATGVRVQVANISQLGRRLRHELGQHLGGHADEAETSLMLAIAPEQVRMDRARADYGRMLDAPRTVFIQPTVFRPESDDIDRSVTGARGDPTLASREKGETLLAEMVRELVDGMRALFPAEAFDAAGDPGGRHAGG